MKLLPFGGKSPTNTIVGVGVTADGEVKTKRVLSTTITTVLSSREIRDTESITTVDNVVNLSDSAVTSIRVINNLNAIVNVQILRDDISGNTSYLYNASGDTISIDIPASKVCIVTADDLPILKSIVYLKFHVAAKTAPTSGALTIKVVEKT